MDKKNSKRSIVKKSSSSLRKPKEKKITHLYFNDKFLKTIPFLGNNRHSLVALYLQNNEIYEITNLENLPNLENLYLQKNRILKLENLENLKSLRKLHLGHNIISVVEGLQNSQHLEELHLEKQELIEGNTLCFDPRTVFGIAHALQVLNISHNKIQTISILSPLKFLKMFDASYNEINNMEEVCEVLKNWFYIEDVSFLGNPVCKSRLYQENVVSSAYCIKILDQKSISDQTRSFLKRLHRERVANRLRKTVNLTDKLQGISKKYSSAIQKAVSVSVLRHHKQLIENNDEIFDERNAVHIPWRTLPKPPNISKLQHVAKIQKRHKNSRATNIVSAFSHLQI